MKKLALFIIFIINTTFSIAMEYEQKLTPPSSFSLTDLKQIQTSQQTIVVNKLDKDIMISIKETNLKGKAIKVLVNDVKLVKNDFLCFYPPSYCGIRIWPLKTNKTCYIQRGKFAFVPGIYLLEENNNDIYFEKSEKPLIILP